MAAEISSGSFIIEGMVVATCSMRTLGAIAQGHGERLVHRAADVVLKERRRLVLLARETPLSEIHLENMLKLARETPLSEIHLENMLKLARMGVTILPPMRAFCSQPATVGDIVDHIVARALDQFGITALRWDGHTCTRGRRRSGHLRKLTPA